MKSIFISHASKDLPIVKSFVDDVLIGALSIKITDVFCTTTDGTKIQSGDDWRNSIKRHLTGAKITFLIITPHYKESEVCLNEMGAAWVTSSKTIPLIVEPINYKTVGVIQEPNQIEKLLDERSLDRIKDIIQETLNIPSKEIKSDRWTTKKIEFIEKAQSHIENNPFNEPLSRETFDESLEETNNLKSALKKAISEKNELKSINKELKKAKDKTDVDKIIKKYKKEDFITEFKSLRKEVNQLLSKLHGIVIGIIYKTNTRKNITVKADYFRNEIDDAISRDYIDEDLEADFVTTKFMQDIERALNNVSNFIDHNEENESFFEYFDETFAAPLSLSNRDFWEEVFDVDVYID